MLGEDDTKSKHDHISIGRCSNWRGPKEITLALVQLPIRQTMSSDNEYWPALTVSGEDPSRGLVSCLFKLLDDLTPGIPRS